MTMRLVASIYAALLILTVMANVSPLGAELDALVTLVSLLGLAVLLLGPRGEADQPAAWPQSNWANRIDIDRYVPAPTAARY